MIDGQNLFDQSVKNNLIKHNIEKNSNRSKR